VSPPHTRGTSVESNGWAESWEAVEAQGSGSGGGSGRSRGNGLEVVLEEGLSWVKGSMSKLIGSIGTMGSGRARAREAGGHEEAYEFEMDEERPG
jgi:hypothetical protein